MKTQGLEEIFQGYGDHTLDIRLEIINRMPGGRLHPKPKVCSVGPFFMSPLKRVHLSQNKSIPLFYCVLLSFEPTLS